MRFAELPTALTSCGHLRVPAQWQLDAARTRSWPDLDLWLLVDGHGHVDTDAERIAIAPGSCLLLRGGESYTFSRARGSTFTHYYVHFDYLRRGRRLDFRRLALPPLHHRVTDLSLLCPLLDRCVAARHREPVVAGRWLDAALLELDHQRERAGRIAGDPQAAAIDATCAAMREDPGAEHPVAGLARAMGLSRSQCTRLFTARTGRPPRRYLTEQRMRTAASLLRESSLPIGQIAEQLGYRDVHFFSRHFKQHHGQSPSAFRAPP
jgi:AraC family transcriptional regulator of arabinose operon